MLNTGIYLVSYFFGAGYGSITKEFEIPTNEKETVTFINSIIDYIIKNSKVKLERQDIVIISINRIV